MSPNVTVYCTVTAASNTGLVWANIDTGALNCRTGQWRTGRRWTDFPATNKQRRSISNRIVCAHISTAKEFICLSKQYETAEQSPTLARQAVPLATCVQRHGYILLLPYANAIYRCYRNSLVSKWVSVFTARCYTSAVLAMGLCLSVCVCVSLCPSVTSRSSTKTAKRRITQITPHDSPGTLVLWGQRSPRNSTGVTPYGGTKCRWGGSKSSTFHKYPAICRKPYKIDAWFLLKSNRKSYALYRMVTLPMTLSAP